MEENEVNPLLEPENYFEAYNKNIDKLKNDPLVVAFDKLCYEVFEATEMGREFLKFATNRFLIGSQVTKGNPTYQVDVIWQEGFRDAYRMIMNHVQSHKQRIQAGAK
jgi:hypothetical protein